MQHEIPIARDLRAALLAENQGRERLRQMDVATIRGFAQRIDAATAIIRQANPDEPIPDFDAADLDMLYPGELKDCAAEGQALAEGLEARVHEVRAQAEAARRESLDPKDREIEDLRARVSALESAGSRREIAPKPWTDPRQPRANTPQLCMPSTNEVRATRGWLDGPIQAVPGATRLVGRAPAETDTRPAMMPVGNHRRALPDAFGPSDGPERRNRPGW